jgi:hypothetical protein
MKKERRTRSLLPAPSPNHDMLTAISKAIWSSICTPCHDSTDDTELQSTSSSPTSKYLSALAFLPPGAYAFASMAMDITEETPLSVPGNVLFGTNPKPDRASPGDYNELHQFPAYKSPASIVGTNNKLPPNIPATVIHLDLVHPLNRATLKAGDVVRIKGVGAMKKTQGGGYVRSPALSITNTSVIYGVDGNITLPNAPYATPLAISIPRRVAANGPESDELREQMKRDLENQYKTVMTGWVGVL